MTLFENVIILGAGETIFNMNPLTDDVTWIAKKPSTVLEKGSVEMSEHRARFAEIAPIWDAFQTRDGCEAWRHFVQQQAQPTSTTQHLRIIHEGRT